MKRICVCTPSVYAASAAAATTALQIKAHHSGKKPVSLLIVRLSFTRKKHIARLSQGKTFHFNSRPFSVSFSISFSLSQFFSSVTSIFIFIFGPTADSFCLFSFFSTTKFYRKVLVFNGNWIQVFWVEGKHPYHLTTTTTHYVNILLSLSTIFFI